MQAVVCGFSYCFDRVKELNYWSEIPPFRTGEIEQLSFILHLFDDRQITEGACEIYLGFLLRFINLAFNPEVYAVSPDLLTQSILKLDKDKIKLKLGQVVEKFRNDAVIE